MPPKLPLAKKAVGLPLGGAKGPGSPAGSPVGTPRSGPPLVGVKGPGLALAKGPGAAPPTKAAGAPPLKAPMKAGGAPPLTGAPGAPAGKAPLMKKLPAPPGAAAAAPAKLALPLGKAPLKMPQKVPAEAAGEAGAGGPKLALKMPPPGGKGPLKLPLKAPPGAKLPLKMPPGGSASGSATASAPPSVAPEDDIAASPRMEGNREDLPASPIPTPRDMPSAATAFEPSLSMTAGSPLASPRGGDIPPPPDTTPPDTPRDNTNTNSATPRLDPASSLTPAAIATPRENLDAVLGGGSRLPPHNASTNPPSPTAEKPYTMTALPYDSTASMLTAMRDGEWPAHRSGTTGSALADFSSGSPPRGGGQDDGAVMRIQRERIEELEGQVRQLERKSTESEKFAQQLEKETARLRETLYDREGAKVIQHISELELENRKLRQQLQRERDTVLYHQQAHMATMDELVKLRHSVDSKGDYDGLKIEYERLTEQVTKLVRANTELSLKVAEITEHNLLISVQSDPSSAAAVGALSGNPAQSGFVRVRRGALCEACAEMVSRWERAVARRQHGGSDLQLYPGAGSIAAQSPLFGGAHDASTSIKMLSTAGATGASLSGVAGGWRVMPLENGSVVYYNGITNRSQWEMPEELKRHFHQQREQQHQRERAAYSPITAGSSTADRIFATPNRAAAMAPNEDATTPNFYNQPLIPQATTIQPSSYFNTGHGTGHYDASSASPYAVRLGPNMKPSGGAGNGPGTGVGMALFGGGGSPVPPPAQQSIYSRLGNASPSALPGAGRLL
jgi:hypothetical protein